MQRPVFIIDGLNMFIRSYAAFPQMSSHGHQMGGCVGFLKTLQRLCREFQPSQVYVTWEGGGSSRRRKLYPDYKLNRRPEKLNRFYGDDIPDSEENKQHQLITLLDVLKCTPVCQIYVSDCEGDDVVSYLCKGPLREKDKVIVSSDKDMYQLLDNSTRIYSLHKKGFVTVEKVFEEFRITAENFAVAKCICGDSSDNIPGIKGVGFKTATNKFPMLGGEKLILVQDVIDYAASRMNESAIYKRVWENAEEIKRNWHLVHLDGSMLSHEQMKKVDYVIDTFKPQVNKVGMIKKLIKEGITDFDFEGFYYDMSCVEGMSYISERNNG